VKEDAKGRAEQYLATIDKALSELKRASVKPVEVGRDGVDHVVKAAERYVSDPRFYLRGGKAVTALACVSYAEGLLDGLLILDLVAAPWPRGGCGLEA